MRCLILPLGLLLLVAFIVYGAMIGARLDGADFAGDA
jgi:uncharacterized membrane protein AbrB (regulator of aidB expression)